MIVNAIPKRTRVGAADGRLPTTRWQADPRGAQIDPDGDGNLFSFYLRSRFDLRRAGGGEAQCDDMRGRGGRDRLRGRGGRDCLGGGTGADRLNGGAQSDRLAGGPGGDYLNARDGDRDKVRCGPGGDRAKVDRKDRVRGCETVKRAG